MALAPSYRPFAAPGPDPDSTEAEFDKSPVGGSSSAPPPDIAQPAPTSATAPEAGPATTTSAASGGQTDVPGDLDGYNADADIQGDPDGPTPDRDYQSYVALGDCFSAGPGWEDGKPLPDPPEPKAPGHDDTCRQRDGGWPVQMWNKLKGDGTPFKFSACTGYHSQEIREWEITHPDSGFGSPDLVSLTMGGNNNNAFANVVEKCPFGYGNDAVKACDDALDQAGSTVEGIDAELDLTLDAAAATNPKDGQDRMILVMGYPSFYNVDTSQFICWRMSPQRRQQINGLCQSLNEKLSQAAGRANEKGKDAGYSVKFVDPDAEGAFDGHRFCEAGLNQRAWFQGLPNGSKGGTDFFIGLFHPTKDGMKAMAGRALSVLSTGET